VQQSRAATVKGGFGDYVLRVSHPDSANVTRHGDPRGRHQSRRFGRVVAIAANSRSQVHGGNGNGILTMNFSQSPIGAG